MSTSRQRTCTESPLRPNIHGDPDLQINVLLLGHTGVGKTTFINAFANYVTYDTLNEANDEEMQVVVPSSFSHTIQNMDTSEDRLIHIGETDQYEQQKNYGHANTLQCRSFVFPIGDRILRFIDTPGVGDTQGVGQDEKNFQDILDYISQFQHLNAIFILLKPNEERLTIFFQYCVNELLRHLHKEAKDNIFFIFTNSRSTFFMPGSTKKLLGQLLEQHRQNYDVVIPFSMANTFLFDSEPFRYLALRKNNVQLDNEQTQSYINSWDRSVQEYGRLMKRVVHCPLHAISHALSLNEAEQLVRKLPRPLAETSRLIQENLQLAEEFKKKVRHSPQILSQGIPQKEASVEWLRPQTVCTSQQCCQTSGESANKGQKRKVICHDACAVNGVKQEVIADKRIKLCEAMHPKEGFCLVCGCSWRWHMHTTYKCETNLTYEKPNTASQTSTDQELSSADIDKRVRDLEYEQAQIQDAYKKMARFLCVNSLLPINDDYIEYLQYYIREEQAKQTHSIRNTDVSDNLERIMADYKTEMEEFKKVVEQQKKAGQQTKTLTPEEVFKLSGDLYRLPINGMLIRKQVNRIKADEERETKNREKLIELPGRAARSKVMQQLQDIIVNKNQNKDTNS